MKVGVEKQAVESRLSSSCPSLAIESGAEGSTPTPRRRGRVGEVTMVHMARLVVLEEDRGGLPEGGG